MQLEGMHHVTMITGDARATVRFYAEVLGLRFVKKTVNFDAPEAYHLYFGDERGAPGSILTWFEFPGAGRGRAGAGMIHTIQLGVATPAALGFWERRLGEHGHPSERSERGLRFAEQVRSGMVHVNDATPLDEAHVPFGGIGASGLGGRAGGEANLEEFTERRWIGIQRTEVEYPY